MTWRALWSDPIARVAVAVTVLVGLPLAFPVLSPDTRLAFNETCTTIPFLVLAIWAFRRALVHASRRERLFWNLMSAAVGCWVAQQLLLIATYRQPLVVAESLFEDTLFVGFYLFLILALDVRPHLRHDTGGRGTLAALRRTGTVVFTLGLLTYFVVVPAANQPDSYWSGIPSFTLYIVLDIYLVLYTAAGLIGSTQRRWRLIYGWLLTTCVGWLIVDLAEALMWSEILPGLDAGTPWDLMWVVPLLSLILVGLVGTPAGEAAGGSIPGGEVLRRAASHGSPLILLAMMVPLIHFGVYGLELFDPATRGFHEQVALGLLIVLGGLVLIYQRTLEAYSRRLEAERREALARVEHEAHHDALTALPNRRLLEDRFRQAKALSDRRNERLAVVFIDVDGFKSINDSHGHAVGDELLRGIGRRLASSTRSSDTVARVGGDEFVVMFTGLGDCDVAARLAARTLQSLREPLAVEGTDYAMRASAGVGIYPDDGTDLDVLMRLADSEMYEDKRDHAGRSGSNSA